MHDVLITFDELLALRMQLDEIITELESAGDRSSELEAAIGRPFGRGDLRDRAGDFESRWNDKRVDLARDMTKVRDHVQGVLEGFAEFDQEAALKLESSDAAA
ncbi:flagellar protein FlgN [Agrococcus sediminis]|jgi:hypothetical protein|uniref:Flagellar protein FlgN n=1 Tax=Agrococcus sediminis TaxID=2599924 RepID=A0A5M8QJG5_9MICO|nr:MULTISPECIES: flagellar protein FlgN [Agrococcus]KAA6435114.1 flagellar protein FlgN [Agrococcus sediminis]MDR7233414.1 hypothetical protein [Agrococcus sp. BE272]RWR22035.1 flagellar protein FlgN [Agrococcus lahaulensis]UOW02046.1 hypothetical protein MU522_06525 [Agrococcus sp. SCSIO52902]